MENQAVVVGVNRCGTDPAFLYDGASAVIDEQGAVLAEAGAGADRGRHGDMPRPVRGRSDAVPTKVAWNWVHRAYATRGDAEIQ